jgi:hypothetical protein
MGLQNQGVTPGRTTLLEAVNVCVESIGEMPVNNLDGSQIDEARVAERILLEVHKETQTRGWEFNTEYQYPFEKDAVTNEVVVPTNVVRWTPNHGVVGRDLQLRGQRVYDRVERTYKFPAEVTEIHADVVWLLPWDDCPEPFNRYVLIRGARIFSARVLGDPDTVKLNVMDEQVALNDLLLMEAENEQYNILTSGPGLRPFPTYVPGWGLARRYAGGGLHLG